MAKEVITDEERNSAAPCYSRAFLESGAPNYLEQHYGSNYGSFYTVVGRLDGKRPVEHLEEARLEVVSLKAHLKNIDDCFKYHQSVDFNADFEGEMDEVLGSIPELSLEKVKKEAVREFAKSVIENHSRTIGQASASGPFDVIEVEHLKEEIRKLVNSDE